MTSQCLHLFNVFILQTDIELYYNNAIQSVKFPYSNFSIGTRDGQLFQTSQVYHITVIIYKWKALSIMAWDLSFGSFCRVL